MKHKIRWTLEKITQRLALISPLVYRRQHQLSPFAYQALDNPSVDPPVSSSFDDRDWPVIPFNAYWGEWQTDFVLRTRFTIPEGWGDPALPLALHLPLGDAGDFIHPEALAYIDAQPLASCDRYHHEIPLPAAYRDGREHLLALHGWTGLGAWREPGNRTQLYMRPCSLVQIDPDLRKFIALVRVSLGVAGHIDENHPARSLLLSGLDRAFRILDTRSPLDERFYRSVPQAYEALLDSISHAGEPIDIAIEAVGHAHIDVAWLWTLGQTRRKSGRTFHNVISLMDRYPDFTFTQSQPQLYDYIRQDYPPLFEAIKEKVSQGRWEAIGGMWVEADCNLTGAEALARQFLLGRSFYQEHFGPNADAPVLWLPDVFGYAWNLPQLIKQAGLEYFFTIKIGWSQYNRMPYDSFWWQGLDGTRVLTHYSTTTDSGNQYASTYNATATPQEAINTWLNFQQKDWGERDGYPPLLMSFGHGDGGGGPTEEMLENIIVMQDFPATPRLQFGKASAFFKQLDEEFGSSLPVWNGELYLEYHRGTYTTQARNKAANRKSEILLHNAEFLATVANALDEAFLYPQDALNHAWRLVCLNQFHDIIPGSSIRQVYEESLLQYEKIHQTGKEIVENALTVFATRFGGALQVINPAPIHRDDLAFIPQTDLPALVDDQGILALTQPVDGGTLIDSGHLAPYSLKVFQIASAPSSEPENALSVSQGHLENAWLRVEFAPSGDITRIYDKVRTREVLTSGGIANQFQAFEDRPMNWDAWDIDIYYDDKVWFAEPAASIEVIETGPLRATLLIRRRILESEIVQRISLTAKGAALNFDTWVNWNQQHILLKVAFPVEILSPVASYEIQWGHVQRPTHRNTSWDWARFETCAHKWADVSEGDYGVSLLNDCKYGYDIQDSQSGEHKVMRLSLLRSPTHPDPSADQGEHRFSYSIFPHPDRVGIKTIAAAYALNNPLVVNLLNSHETEGYLESAYLALGASWFDCDHPNILIETIKRTEKGNGVILRLYESLGQRGVAQLKTVFPVQEAWQTDLLERDRSQLEIIDGKVQIPFKPFQIITLRLTSSVMKV